MKNISLIKDCYGCGVCSASCPKNIISMQLNQDGFYEPKIVDPTVFTPERYQKYLGGGEYKFYEDENYEYYYSSHKTEIVQVYFKNGDILTVEEALKQGKITMDLLDKYGVEYSKKEKK